MTQDTLPVNRDLEEKVYTQLGVEKYVAGPFTTNRAEKRRIQRIVRRVQKVRK
jgi:hypothetical protein